MHNVGKRLSECLSCVLILIGLLAGTALAADASWVNVELRPSVTILIDGIQQNFYDVTGKEVHPIYYQGTHYLPVRAIGELMGKNVNWDGATRTITLSSPRTTGFVNGTPDATTQDSQIRVELRPDISIVVDGSKCSFTDAKGNTVYPLLNSGTNYLPVRAIGELMGKAVSWNSSSRTIVLSGGTTVNSGTGNEPQVIDADTFGILSTITNIGTEINAGINAGLNAGTNSGTNSGTNMGINAGMNTGTNINTGTNMGTNTGINTGMNTGVNAGTNSGTNSGTNMGSNSGTNTGTNMGTNTGTNIGTSIGTNIGTNINIGTNLGMNTGTNAGTNSGTNVGTNAGTNSGMNSGMNSGSNTGTNSGTNAGSNAGTNAGTNSGTNAGSNAGTNAGTNLGTNMGTNMGSNGLTGGTANFIPPADNSNKNYSYIGGEKARSIALEHVPGASANHVTKIKLDRDNNEYKIEISYQGLEYRLEIDAKTGAILEYEIDN